MSQQAQHIHTHYTLTQIFSHMHDDEQPERPMTTTWLVCMHDMPLRLIFRMSICVCLWTTRSISTHIRINQPATCNYISKHIVPFLVELYLFQPRSQVQFITEPHVQAILHKSTQKTAEQTLEQREIKHSPYSMMYRGCNTYLYTSHGHQARKG